MVEDSINVNVNIKDKTILVFDNTVITGATVTEVFHKLKNKGAKDIIFFCIGLGAKAKDIDFDLNPVMKKGHASQIMQGFTWPKVSKELREQYHKLKEDKELKDAAIKDMIDNPADK